MVGAEISAESAVAKHVKGGGQDRGGNGADGLFGSAAMTQALKLSLQVVGLFVVGRPRTMHQGRLQPSCALAQPVEHRLPALSWLRGHSPAQEIRWPAVGKRAMCRSRRR